MCIKGTKYGIYRNDKTVTVVSKCAGHKRDSKDDNVCNLEFEKNRIRKK